MITVYLEFRAKSVTLLIHTVKIISPGGYLPKPQIYDPISRKIPADLAGAVILGPLMGKWSPLNKRPHASYLSKSSTLLVLPGQQLEKQIEFSWFPGIHLFSHLCLFSLHPLDH